MNRKRAALVVLAPCLVLGSYLALRRYPRVPMERYVPASALGFVEVDSLGDVMSGLTGTLAWRELAPLLGVSSQLGQIGLITDLMGRTGIGPAEAVVIGRGQYAVVITGLDAESNSADDRLNINLRPRFCLVLETHAKPETASSCRIWAR